MDTCTMSRRNALSTLSAIAATPLVAEADQLPLISLPAAVPSAADADAYFDVLPATSNELFVRYGGEGDENWMVGFSTTAEQADRRKPRGVRRQAFRPASESARFCVVSFEWELPSPFFFYEYPEKPPEAVLLAYHEALAAFPLPSSLVEVPPGFMGQCYVIPEDGPFERAAALERVAALNGEIADAGGELGMTWHALIEIGERVADWRYAEVSANGLGILKALVGEPCRIYRPTAAELKRYPLTWESLSENQGDGNQHNRGKGGAR